MPSEERCQGTNPGSSYFFGRSIIIAGRNLVHKRQDSSCGGIKGASNIIQGSSSKRRSLEDDLLKLQLLNVSFLEENIWALQMYLYPCSRFLSSELYISQTYQYPYTPWKNIKQQKFSFNCQKSLEHLIMNAHK